MTCGHPCKGSKPSKNLGEVLQAEGTASARILRQEGAWHMANMMRRPCVWRAVHPACALVHPRFLNPLPMPPLPLPTWNSNSNPSSNSSLIPKIRSHSTLLCGFPQDSAALLICHPALYLEASQSLESDTTLFKTGTTSDS